jgi:hypothetical protein
LLVRIPRMYPNGAKLGTFRIADKANTAGEAAGLQASIQLNVIGP